MSYLKLTANAMWAGAYCSCLVWFLILFFNHDSAPRSFMEGLWLLLAVALVYLPATCLVYPALFACLRFFAARRLGIRWMSLKAIVWFGIAILGTMTAVYYVNIRWSEAIVSPEVRTDLRISSAVMAACLALAVVMASLGQFRTRSVVYRRLGGLALLVPLVVTALLLRGDLVPHAAARPAAADGRLAAIRPPIRPAGSLRLLLIGIQAASMDTILPLVSSRELPTFEMLLKEGASSRLDTLRPCRSRVAWATVMAGMLPWSTGIKDDIAYRLPGSWWLGALPRSIGLGSLTGIGYVQRRPWSSSEARFSLFPDLIRASGTDLELVGWNDLFGEESGSIAVDPRDPRVAAHMARMLTSGSSSGAPASGILEAVLRDAIASDVAVHARAMESLREPGGGEPRVLASRFSGLGPVSEHFLRYHLPDEFGDVTPEERTAYGRVLPMYYKFLDELLGEQIKAAGPAAYVMVMSPHGVEPVSWWERFPASLYSRPEPPQGWSGSWLRGPDGILLLQGEGVSPGTKLDEAGLIDVLPTCLYMLGLPIRRDMPGSLLRRLFDREFRETHPVLFVPGYERSVL